MEFSQQFTISFRYELFYALQLLTEDQATMHETWKSNAVNLMPEATMKNMEKYGLNSIVWAVISGMLPDNSVNMEFQEIVHFFRTVPLKELQWNVVEGIVHYDDISRELIDGAIELTTAVSMVPYLQLEWFEFVGLYPYDEDAPVAKALYTVIKNPELYRRIVIESLTIFYDNCFYDTWERIKPQLKKAAEEKRKLNISCDNIGEFARQILLPVNVDATNSIIRSIHSNTDIRLDDIENITFLPTVFNYRKIWETYTSSSTEDKLDAYFSFFEASIFPEVTFSVRRRSKKSSNVTIADLSAVFKAMGDATRYRIVTYLADEPMNSAELAKKLSISKATVSHHVNTLREAGLLDEDYQKGSVRLSVKREIFESLSDNIVKQIFHKD